MDNIVQAKKKVLPRVPPDHCPRILSAIRESKRAEDENQNDIKMRELATSQPVSLTIKADV